MEPLYYLWFLVIGSGAALVRYGLEERKKQKKLENKEIGEKPAYLPEVPDEFDPNFIQQEVKKIEHSPVAKEVYFSILKKKFIGERESDLLQLIIAYNEQDVAGTISEKELYEMKKELEEVKKQWRLTRDSSVIGLEKEAAILGKEEIIARTKGNIRRYNQLYPEAGNKNKGSKGKTTEEIREMMKADIRITSEDAREIDKVYAEELAKVDEQERKELAELESMDLDPKEKEWKEEEIRTRHSNVRASILNSEPRGIKKYR